MKRPPTTCLKTDHLSPLLTQETKNLIPTGFATLNAPSHGSVYTYVRSVAQIMICGVHHAPSTQTRHGTDYLSNQQAWIREMTVDQSYTG